MVNSPVRAYGTLLVVIVAAVSGAVILSGFVAIDFVLGTVTVWGYMAAIGVTIACTVASWLTDLPGILPSEFGSGG